MQINDQYQTPHLTTAMTGPLNLLEQKLLSKQNEIEEWFKTQWKLSPAPIYGSVDLRNSGFKLAPIDMNLFPAGFNNLNPEFLPLSVEAAKIAIEQHVPHAKKILIIPEKHTRNIFYWHSVKIILKILTDAGFEVKVGSLSSDLHDVQLPEDGTIQLDTITRNNNHIQLKDFVPDVILLNNDLSEGIPDILKNLDHPIIPPAELGWSQRLKSGHFRYYHEVSQEFAKFIAIDPWFISPLFRHCGEIDFMQREGEDCLAKNVKQLLDEINKKYQENNITCVPFVIIKADAGTYGMAVMTVRSADEILTLNRKQRTHMSTTKGGRPVSKVILQEGVYTFETWGPENAVAEPVVYLWGERVVGGFYRVHQNRGRDENLNTPGMQFEPLAFAKSDEFQNRFYAYGVIARLSMLAAARELLEQTA